MFVFYTFICCSHDDMCKCLHWLSLEQIVILNKHAIFIFITEMIDVGFREWLFLKSFLKTCYAGVSILMLKRYTYLATSCYKETINMMPIEGKVIIKTLFNFIS